jgi:hypothetical protein
MRQREKKPIGGVVVGVLGLGITGWMICNWAPDVWWKEVSVSVSGFISIFLLFSWLLGRKKWGGAVTMLIFGLLILNRLGMLDILTGMLLVVVLGLISLIN